MTAPAWLAEPPEVHSALLSSGPGPGPLLAAADAWATLSAEYGEIADELEAVLSDLRIGFWDGATAENYVTAHAPYLEWLRAESQKSSAQSVAHAAAATAYTTALTAMPTLPEIAANHATHAALAATNFFGINTIPLAVNEADYGRMWVQAATVMSAYQQYCWAATASAPRSDSAPSIARPAESTWSEGMLRWFNEVSYFFNNLLPQPQLPNIDNFPFYQQLLDFFYRIGFREIEDPFAGFWNSLNGSSWLPPGSWLAFTGNPLSYLNPVAIAYMFSVPLEPISYIIFTSKVIIDGMLAVLYTALFNPPALILVVPLVMVEIIGSTIGNTIQVLNYILQSTLAIVVPAVIAMLGPTALAAVPVSGAAGLAGLAGLAALPPVTPTPPPMPAFAMAPSTAPPPPSPPPPSPAPVATAHAPAMPPAPSPPPPTPAGPIADTMANLMYMIADLGLAARRGAGTGAGTRKKAPSGSDQVREPEPAPQDARTLRRKRRMKTTLAGRGHEYVDLDDEPAVHISDQGAGDLGLITSGARARVNEGLTSTRRSDAKLGESATMPLIPGTWTDEVDPNG